MSWSPPSLPPPSSPAGGPPPPAQPAGWYDDPWDPRRQRYWDGATWTGYTDDLYGSPVGVVEDAAALARSNEGTARWLRMAVLANPVVQAISVPSSVAAFRKALDQFDDLQNGRTTPSPFASTGAWSQASRVLSLVGFLVLVLRMVWLYRASRAAESLGYPLRRGPGLACAGWIIPIVNFWWPYQGMASLFPADDPIRRRVAHWWTCYLVASIGGVVGALFTIRLPLVGDVVAIALPAAVGMLGAVLERGLVAEVQRRQLEEAGGGAHR